ncbi:UPF0220 protein [Venustampulla echinocandica]|uniref:UPF0220 protein n=1 Tax=Venustampulla echinocandica TaxID=2656787 RepID=A0A370TI25_9HELO|nr:UPF0220 protein [Venustampulla echinocandica]RDL35004.1 UPF0220 protein [Venustampulla echinocandica]
MAERRHATSSSTHSHRSTGVRRNLFHHQLSRRPTTSSTSTSAETVRLDVEHESDTSDIVIRDKNGEFEIGDPPMQSFDEQEEGGNDDTHEDQSKKQSHSRRRPSADGGEEERQRLADAVKHHQRDRNRAPSEPAELLEAVRSSLRTKVAALADDNWMHEAEADPTIR